MIQTKAMQTLTQRYDTLTSAPSDINEHLPVLRRYAAAVTNGRAAELGVRGVVSTWALLLGLSEAGHAAPTLLSVDIAPSPGIEEAQRAAAGVGIAHHFLLEDSTRVVLPGGPVDLLFIDTWHVHAQLARELAHHAPNVRRWILLHDTEVDRDWGESVRRGMNVEEQQRNTGYPVDDIRRHRAPAAAAGARVPAFAPPSWSSCSSTATGTSSSTSAITTA